MKIEALFELLAQRYGAYELKPGQSLDLIKKTWCHSVGRYSRDDIKSAMLSYFSAAKYPRWPEEGQFIEILKSFMAKPESTDWRDDRPVSVQDAEKRAGAFYLNVLSMPAPSGAFPFTPAHALNHIIGLHEEWAFGKSFGWLLTNAWLKGKIPQDFDRKADEYFKAMKAQKDKYVSAVKQHGHVAVHERRVGL